MKFVFLLAVAAAEPFFEQLPEGSQVTGMSRGGSGVVGTTYSQDASGAQGGKTPFLWTLADGFQVLEGGGSDGNPGISRDGAVIAGTAGTGLPGDNTSAAAVWRDGAWVALPGTLRPSAVYSLSPDGAFAAGLAATTEGHVTGSFAAVWNVDGTGAHYLNSTVAGMACRANAISDGGEVVAGWQDLSDGYRAGAVWRNGTQALLMDDDGENVGEVLVMDSEGEAMAGYHAFDHSSMENVAWLLLPGQERVRRLKASAVFAISEGGTVVGGSVGDGFSRTGFIWTEGSGEQPLLSVLRDRGVPLPENITEAELGSVMAMSGDGLTLAGWGMKMPGGPTGWVARMDALSVLV